MCSTGENDTLNPKRLSALRFKGPAGEMLSSQDNAIMSNSNADSGYVTPVKNLPRGRNNPRLSMTSAAKNKPLAMGNNLSPSNWFAKAINANDSTIMSDQKSEYGREDLDYLDHMS